MATQRECALEKHEAIERARAGILAFTRYTKPDYEINWHHLVMARIINKFARGEIQRLMIFMPPRHGKTEMMSRRLSAYLLGRNPDEQIISCSYSADLAARSNRDVQRIIDTDTYREVFPNTRLSGSNVRTVAQESSLRNSDMFEIVGHNGSYKNAGVGGPITGGGMNTGLIDDPIKNADDAASVIKRDRMWEWYNSTFYTRLEKNGRIGLIMTRWHEDDIAGRALKLAAKDPEAEQWTVLCLPAVNENGPTGLDPRQRGQVLWPSKFDERAMKKKRTTMGLRTWSALYQQSPAPLEGNIFKRKWWKFYREEPSDLIMHLISWDTTFKDKEKSDFVAGIVLATRESQPASIYVLGLVHDRMDYVTTRAAVVNATARWPLATDRVVEDSANGAALISDLGTVVSGLVAIPVRGSKLARAEAISPGLEAGNFYLPLGNPISEVIIEQCAKFPNAAHDDIVDALSQGVTRMRQRAKKVGAPTILSAKKRSQWK